MPQKSKKSKKKGNVKRKTDNEADKGEQSKYVGKGMNGKNLENLSRHFTDEELQDLRTVLKNKDLSKVPLVIATVILSKFILLRKLVQEGYNVNEMGPNRTTPLMFAVKCKNMEIVNYLLLNGADASAKNDNGDNVLFMALENRFWDEQSFIALWNHIKSVAYIDINFMSKHGRNMLHTTIRREWNDFLNMLILENVNVNATNSNKVTPLMLASYFNNLGMVDTLLQTNADILKEDVNGCTALCYAISYTINKSLQMPHLVVDKLVAALHDNGITFKDYFEKQIDFILNAPVKQSKCGQPLPDIKASIIPYALRYSESTLKTLFELNIFGKMAEVSENCIDEPYHMMKFLEIINEVLQYCERCFGTGLTEKHLLESFVTDGAANLCLAILKKYGRETVYNYDFTSSAFAPLLTVTESQIEGRSWLYNNYGDVLPFYTSFLASYSMDGSNNFLTKRNNGKILKFTEQINKIKLENALYENKRFDSESTLKAPKAIEGAQDTQEIEENKSGLDSSPKESKPEPKSNAKKTKRRAKALRAKIAKIKSADLTERLNLNGRMLEQKCVSDTSIIKTATKSNKSEPDVAPDEDRAQEWQKHSAWEQIWLMDSTNQPVIKEFNETITLLENQMLTDFSEDIFDTNIQATIDFTKNQISSQRRELVSLYPDWKNKSLSSVDIAIASKELDFKSELQDDSNSFDLTETPVKSKVAHEEISDLITFTLNYLSGLLQRIFVTYQEYWEQERECEDSLKNDQGDVPNEHGKLNNMKNLIKKLEMEHIEHVQMQFDTLVAYIKDNAEMHLMKCCKIIDRLESLFMNHRIRGKSLMTNTPIQVVKVNRDFDESFGDLYEIDEELANSAFSLDTALYNRRSSDDFRHSPSNTSSSTLETVDILLQGHPDALYLQEVLSLPPKPPPNPDKVRADKIQTMKNAYHLVPSIIQLCTDETDEILQKPEESQETAAPIASTSKYKKRQTLQETLLAMPSIDDPNKLLEALEKSQSNTEYQSPCENATSRWCGVIRSFQLLKHYHTLNGDIRVSKKDKEDSHTISSGGNFSSVILGLDSKDRPLAVKRIQKDSSVCRIMKDLLNPLLGLRNTNLLHYFSCNYEENELVVATPLCEYNMGEYVMFMKQSPNMYVRSVDIVKQFLAGLRFLHDRVEPIVHGNLKPSNIFLDLSGIVRIAEFGMHKALYTLTEAPNTSVIWFSRETFNLFKETSCLNCTCASDVQVAGMLIHFILTAGKHPYGESMEDILKNLERAVPQLITTDVDLHDLISWMLLFEPGERPTIHQVLSHVFFWNLERKWRFILACAGVSPHGSPLNIPLNELHLYINIVANKENIKGSWISITKRRFVNLKYSKDDQDSITGLLKFIRCCIQNQVALRINGDYEFRNFILSAFPALPLSLYRILESSQWLNHRVLQPFTTVDSLSA